MIRRTRFARILCPIDFSPQSKAAFARACAIAREHQAELRLLHVMEPGTRPFTTRLDAATHDTIMKRLRNLLGQSGERVRLGAAIREGQPAREILRMASRFSADLNCHGAGAALG
jgi:nucleotide-binding universal stress UspA family protein